MGEKDGKGERRVGMGGKGGNDGNGGNGHGEESHSRSHFIHNLIIIINKYCLLELTLYILSDRILLGNNILYDFIGRYEFG